MSIIDLLIFKLCDFSYDEMLVVDPQTTITSEDYEKIKS